MFVSHGDSILVERVFDMHTYRAVRYGIWLNRQLD